MKEKEKQQEKRTVSGTLTTSYVVGTFMAIGLAVRHLLFDENTRKDELQMAICVILYWLGTIFIVTVVVCLVSAQFKENPNRNKYEGLVSLALLTCFAWLPRVMAFFDTGNLWIYVYIALFGIIVSKTAFLSVFSNDHEIYFNRKDPALWVLVFSHLFGIAYCIYVATYFTNVYGVIAVQIIFFPMCTLTAFEFHSMLRGDFKRVIKMKAVEVKDVEHGNEECCNLVLEEFGGKIECKICLLPFNQCSRTPRMLKECGHTICENCAEQLLKKNEHQYVNCPFCQKETPVAGPASKLPKNFIILDMFDEQKEVKPKILEV